MCFSSIFSVLAFLPFDYIIKKTHRIENTETFDFGGNFSVYDNWIWQKR